MLYEKSGYFDNLIGLFDGFSSIDSTARSPDPLVVLLFAKLY